MTDSRVKQENEFSHAAYISEKIKKGIFRKRWLDLIYTALTCKERQQNYLYRNNESLKVHDR